MTQTLPIGCETEFDTLHKLNAPGIALVSENVFKSLSIASEALPEFPYF